MIHDWIPHFASMTREQVVVLFTCMFTLVIPLTAYWYRKLGVVGTLVRCLRFYSYAFLVYLLYRTHIDTPFYCHTYVSQLGHPPLFGDENMAIQDAMFAWVVCAVVEMICSPFLDNERVTLARLSLIERSVTVFWWNNPTCMSRIVSDAVVSLVTTAFVWGTDTDLFVYLRKRNAPLDAATYIVFSNSRNRHKTLLLLIRSIMSSFPVAFHMCIYIAMKRNGVVDPAQAAASTTAYHKTPSSYINFAVWQLCIVCIQWCVYLYYYTTRDDDRIASVVAEEEAKKID
jgi:hypothetical protein